MPQNTQPDLAARVTKLEENLRLAFPVNDLGQPDFDGHRKEHTGQRQESERMVEFRTAVTKKVLLLGVAALATMLGSGFTEYLKAIFTR